MAEPPDPPKPSQTDAQARREARLAAALRENLHRRKAQNRARAEEPSPAPSSPAAETPRD